MKKNAFDLRALFQELPEDFQKSELFKSALTHKSHFFETSRTRPHNERLEFLGDSALGLCITDLLYTYFPQKDEGFLTKARSALVNTKKLSEKAKALGLEDQLQVGRSEINKESELPARVLASTLEALFGAIYLKLSISHLRPFIERIFAEELENEDLLLSLTADWKSQLQEELQKRHQKTPSYEVVSSDGPDHNKVFRVHVFFEGTILGEGVGSSRKEAEQEAAKQALQKQEELTND